MPRLSIITPCLNAAAHIEEAIRSVLAQNSEGVEHIVVDGGSRDGTVGILQNYPHLRWISEPDHGQSHAMNKGFAMAGGAVVGYLNADDYYLPGAFQDVLPRFDQGDDFVVGAIRVENEDGTHWINNSRVGHLDMLRHWEPEAFCVNSVGYFYRRDVQARVGGFNESNHFAMDLEFLLDASSQVRITKIDRLLGVFRYRSGSVTGRSQQQESTWTRETFRFIDRFLESLPADFVREFERERTKGYLKRIGWMNEDLLRKLESGAAGTDPGRLRRLKTRLTRLRLQRRIAAIRKQVEKA